MDRVNRILKNELYCAALKQLDTYEENRRFCRHDMDHFLSVARIMLLRAMEEEIAIEKALVYATALLHDIGRIEQYENGAGHASASAALAQEILLSCGFNEEEVAQSVHAIRSHNSGGAEDDLGHLLQYADKKSRNCFCCSAYQDCYWPETQKNQGVVL